MYIHNHFWRWWWERYSQYW